MLALECDDGDAAGILPYPADSAYARDVRGGAAAARTPRFPADRLASAIRLQPWETTHTVAGGRRTRAEVMIGHKNPQGLAPPRRSAGNASDREILGDWSNLKGTDYHLVYAIWLVLCAGVSEVAFYRGNDLLVR